MAPRPLTFRRRDVTAAIRAVEAAGYRIARVEIDREGTIIIVPAREGSNLPEPSPWDEVLRDASAPALHP